MQPVDPAMVKYLRVLVTALTATMIIGFIIITALFVTRFAGSGPVDADVTLPVSITLPDGTDAAAFTQGGDWYAVVTGDDNILIFDRTSGALRQTIRIDLE
ncbi:hypothetical protein DC366_03240 [Pelagivirga sediminicola]|uniref:Uncharacterized protein n=2 Tax=Pelagivirga sediminicola TaxID=2170575 RepID=A0A2T7GCG5_9RHOB|nr:hypothetical protein DC366_03240 [Pelagivirga sediminicola]